MGKGLIVGSSGEGLYQVKLTYKPVEALKKRLDDELLALSQRISDSENTLGQTWREVAMDRAAIDALIEQYRTGEITDDDADREPGEPVQAGDWANDVIALTNQRRADAGLDPVIAQAQLGAAARQQADYLMRLDKLSHAGDGGSMPRDRATSAGYTLAGAVGENVAAGQSSPDAVVKAWFDSPPHRANLLNAHFVSVGVWVSVDAMAIYRYYWCQVFGSL